LWGASLVALATDDQSPVLSSSDLKPGAVYQM
jgi:hypothetical protein